jgi:molecular chaperone GrpE
MSDKKNKPASEELEASMDDDVVEAGQQQQEEAAQELIEALRKDLGIAQAQAAENLDGWQRAQAEFMNYKNRVQRDQELMRSNMKGDILRRVLPVLDDLERALANRPDKDPWAEGMQLVVRKFQTILESEGLTRIAAEGQSFDPNFHEAISHEPSDEVQSGHVIAVVQNGYMLGERVIRPAMVRVAQ